MLAAQQAGARRDPRRRNRRRGRRGRARRDRRQRVHAARSATASVTGSASTSTRPRASRRRAPTRSLRQRRHGRAGRLPRGPLRDPHRGRRRRHRGRDREPRALHEGTDHCRMTSASRRCCRRRRRPRRPCRTAELTAAGKRVLLLDQEGRDNLGGQAFWSLGGLFLVDSPEQRRLRHPRLTRARVAGLDRQRRLRPSTTRTAGPCAGPTPTSSGPRGRSARGSTSTGITFVATVGWPERGGCRADGTATPSRASTSPGAPAPASSSRSSTRRTRPSRAGCSTIGHRHRVDELLVSGGAVTGAARRRPRRRRRTARGVDETATSSASSSSRASRHRDDRRDRRQPRLVRRYWPSASAPRPVDAHRRARVRRRADARHRRRRRRPPRQPRPHVALHRGRPELEPHLAGHAIRILPGPSSLWFDALGRRLPIRASRASTLSREAPAHDAGHRGYDHSWFITTQRSCARSSACPARSRTPTSRAATSARFVRSAC